MLIQEILYLDDYYMLFGGVFSESKANNNTFVQSADLGHGHGQKS